MSKSDKTLVIGSVFLLVILLVIGTFFVLFRDSKSQANLQKQGTGNTALVSTKSSESLNRKPSKETDLAINDSAYALSGKLLAYSVNKGKYPAPTLSGWNGFTSAVKDPEDIKSPITQRLYVFTETDPAAGEIQYRSPSSCDGSYLDFKPIQAPKTYAFRVRFSGGDIRCFTTI